MTVANLDREAARCGQAIVGTCSDRRQAEAMDRVVTKALGVFQEDGLYAGLLYLYSRSPREIGQAKAIRSELLNLLNSDTLIPLGFAFTEDVDRWTNVAEFLTRDGGLTTDLDALLLVKELFERALIYARYATKSIAAAGAV